VSAGVLGRDLEIAAFHTPESTHGFLVTDEAVPGAITPSDHRMLVGELT
jgi:hypothetical protein